MRLTMLIVAICVVACSSRQIYESSEDMREQYCKDLDDHARERCLDQARMPYDEYEDNRQDSLDGG